MESHGLIHDEDVLVDQHFFGRQMIRNFDWHVCLNSLKGYKKTPFLREKGVDMRYQAGIVLLSSLRSSWLLQELAPYTALLLCRLPGIIGLVPPPTLDKKKSYSVVINIT
jgi:hypothetical protein